LVTKKPGSIPDFYKKITGELFSISEELFTGLVCQYMFSGSL